VLGFTDVWIWGGQLRRTAVDANVQQNIRKFVSFEYMESSASIPISYKIYLRAKKLYTLWLDHRAQLEFDVQTSPECAFRDPKGIAKNNEVYKLCLTHAQSSYTSTQANYKMVTLSDLCPFTSPPAMSANDRGADATVYDGLHHFGAVFDQRTYMMYMEDEYKFSTSAFAPFTSVILFFVVGSSW